MRLMGVATIAWRPGSDSRSTCRSFHHLQTRSKPFVAYARTHDIKAVVDHIVTETYEGLNVSGYAAMTG